MRSAGLRNGMLRVAVIEYHARQGGSLNSIKSKVKLEEKHYIITPAYRNLEERLARYSSISFSLLGTQKTIFCCHPCSQDRAL